MSGYLQLDTLLYRVVAFLLIATLHDFVQSLTALILGDRLPQRQGRLSLNPLVHLHTLGLAMVLFGPYGWGKTIEIDRGSFRRNPKMSAVLVYASGLIFLFLLGLFFWWLYFKLPLDPTSALSDSAFFSYIKSLVHHCFIVCVLMLIVNLFPFYPMDMWKMLRSAAPERVDRYLGRVEVWGIPLMIALMVLPAGVRLLEKLFLGYSGFIMNSYAI